MGVRSLSLGIQDRSSLVALTPCDGGILPIR